MTRNLFVLFLASFLYTCIITSLNARAIREQNPENHPSNARSLVSNSTVYSIDNYWYVNQFKNLIRYGRFTADVNKDRYEVRRTPVYPIFYGLHFWLFGEENSYRVIRYTQALVLALAVVALFLAVYRFTSSSRIAWLAAILYGGFPMFPVTTQYTITEALSSELVCFSLYFLSLAWRDKRYHHWFLAGLTFALGALCRPTIVFLAIPVAGILWYASEKTFRGFILNGIVFSAGALLLFAPWTIRNYRLTGDVILLEKYYGDPMDYGMPNIRLRHWIACWTNPADYTSEQVSNKMRENLMYQEPISRDSLIGSFMTGLPARALNGNSDGEVRQAFTSLYNFYAGQFREAGQDEMLRLETTANNELSRLRENVIRNSPFQFYIGRHVLFLKSIIFQSNAYGLAFLDDYAGNPLRKAGRILMYLISVLSWFSLLLLFPWRRNYGAIYWTSVLFAILSIAGALIVLEYYEARYSVPVFPLLFCCLAAWLIRMKDICLNGFKSL